MAKALPSDKDSDYLAIFDENPDALFILGKSGQILTANQSAARRYGYTLAELSQMNAVDLAAPEMKNKVPAQFLNLHPSGDQFEWKHRRKDGSELPVEIYSHPIIHQGEHAILASVRDISQRKQAELALHKSNELLQTVVQNAPARIFWKDRDSRFLGCNIQFAQDAGRTRPDELTGKTDFEMGWKDRAEQYRADDKAVMESGNPKLAYEEQQTTPDGNTIWLSTSKVPLRDETNQVIGVLGIYQNITEIRQARALLGVQKQVLEMIASGVPLPETLDALIRHIETQAPGMLGSILLLDEDGVHVRRGAAPSLPEEFVAAIDGEPIGPVAGSCGTAVYRKEAVFVEDIATDPLWANYKATALPHGLHACWSTPIFNAQRQVLGTFAMYYRQPGLPQPEHLQLIDTVTHLAAIAITHHRADAALQASEEKLRLFIQHAPSAIAMFDCDMRYLAYSQRWLTDYDLDEQELAGRSHYEVFPDLPERWKEMHRRSLTGTVEKCEEDPFPRADESVDWVRWETHPWQTSEGSIGGIIIFSEVITKRKQAEEALRESEAKFRAIIESSPVALAMNDEHGNITLLNRKFIETFGYTPADIPTLAEWWLCAYPDPAYRQRVAQEWQAAVEKAQRDQTELEPVEYKVTGKDGLMHDIRFSMASIGVSRLVILYDITELKQAEAELRKLSLAVEQSPNSIIIANLDATIEYVNDTFLKMTGYSRDEVIGKNPSILQSGKTPKATHEDMWAHLTRGEIWRGELINKRKDGSEYIELAMISPVRQADGRITHYLAIKENITETKQAEASIERLTHFDQLTGLPNHSLLNDRFKFAFSLAQRSGEALTVMFLDLDHFKNINDTLGHSIGDQLLMEVAKRIKETLREEDTVSRLGGDEFILILPDTDADGAANVAAKLIKVVSQPCQIEQYELITTASIGIAIYPHDGEDFETLSKHADAAMYRVKQAGRNNFCFYTPEMQAHSARTLQLANALRHALARNELQLHYQPQISLRDGHIIGAEALLRWVHPELGMISPAEFILIAEDSGQIIPIGEWVLRTAASQLKAWMDGGMAPMVMAVNLSAVQFRQHDITELITQILDEVQLPHEYLELELTEAVAMEDPLAAIEVMNKLYGHGIRMSIDDFGTGYSSLSYLKKFKVYKLKIDQSFVRDITDDPDDKAIVSAIINLASSLGIHTIAEGVESAGQLAFLRLQGCDEVQGYYFSKPLPAGQFVEFANSELRK